MLEKTINKEAIIAEYLTGEYSYRQLGVKHGIDFRKIHSWVSNYKGKIKPVKKASKMKEEASVLPAEVKQLQAELHKVKLHNEVLEDLYNNFEEAQHSVAKAISVYNYLRPHSSISYKTPIELHNHNEPVERKWKNYYVKKELLNVGVADETYR